MNVTDGDRDKAARALWPLTRYRWPRDDEMTEEQRAQWDRIATALAEEREKARAQFCALLAVSPTLVDSNDNPRGYLVSLPLLSMLGITASDIDHAVEETTE